MIYNRRQKISGWVLPIVLILSFGALYYFNYLYVSKNPGGTDFLVQWVGTKMLVVNEMNPYQDETSLAIQQQAEIQGIKAQTGDLQFQYPLYSVVIFSIFALVPEYLTARALWMVLLEISLLAFCWYSLKLFDSKSRFLGTIIFMTILLLGFHSIFPIINGDVIILIGLFLVLGIYMIKMGGDEIAGVLIAFTTIKGLPIILLYVFLLFWVIRTRRWNILIWFLITIVLLSASSALFIPRWILDNIGTVLQNPTYAPYATPGRSLAALWFPEFGIRMGWLLSLILSLLLLYEWRNVHNEDFGTFAWLSAVSIVFSQWIGIPSEPSNYVLIYPGLALVFLNISGRWSERSLYFFLFAFGLFSLGVWIFYFINLVFYNQHLALHPGFLFLLPLFTILGLFWIRWWMLHPSRGLDLVNY